MGNSDKITGIVDPRAVSRDVDVFQDAGSHSIVLGCFYSGDSPDHTFSIRGDGMGLPQAGHSVGFDVNLRGFVFIPDVLEVYP